MIGNVQLSPGRDIWTYVRSDVHIDTGRRRVQKHIQILTAFPGTVHRVDTLQRATTANDVPRWAFAHLRVYRRVRVRDEPIYALESAEVVLGAVGFAVWWENTA